jgi:hypothetical protein
VVSVFVMVRWKNACCALAVRIYARSGFASVGLYKPTGTSVRAGWQI